MSMTKQKFRQSILTIPIIITHLRQLPKLNPANSVSGANTLFIFNGFLYRLHELNKEKQYFICCEFRHNKFLTFRCLEGQLIFQISEAK